MLVWKEDPIDLETFGKQLIEFFRQWNIEIPMHYFTDRTSYASNNIGSWRIEIDFGQDENGDYIEVFRSHRMSDSEFYRFYYNKGLKYIELSDTGTLNKTFSVSTYDRKELPRWELNPD